MNEVVAKGAFLSKVRPPIYAAVHAVMLKPFNYRIIFSRSCLD